MTVGQGGAGRTFRIVARERAFDGYFKIIRYRIVHDLFSGGEGPEIVREVFERGRAVAVLPYDPERDQVVLVEQFRPGVVGVEEDPWLIETVAGIIEPGEDIETVARRETREEAGLDLVDLRHIHRYFVSPGGTTETVDLFVARVDLGEAGGLFGLPEEGEDIKVHLLAVDEALHWLQTGRIRSATAIVALQWLALNRHHVKAGDEVLPTR